MLARLHRIRFEVCKNETDALLMESMLIRSIRPEFNSANKSPETYYFISTFSHPEALELRLSMRPLNDYQQSFGSFKGHINVRKGLGALIRLHMMCSAKITNAMFLPQHLLRKLVPLRTMVKPDLIDPVLLKSFLSGESDELIRYLIDACAGLEIDHPFTESFLDHELDALSRFYFSNPRANYLISRQMNFGSAFIPQNERDDLQVLFQK
jgi:excinuclease UvrABC nuclease subunit